MRSVTGSILKRQCGEVFSKQQHDYTKTLVAATLRADVEGIKERLAKRAAGRRRKAWAEKIP